MIGLKTPYLFCITRLNAVDISISRPNKYLFFIQGDDIDPFRIRKRQIAHLVVASRYKIWIPEKLCVQYLRYY